MKLSVQSHNHVWLFATPWTAACQSSLSITNFWSPTKPMSIVSVMPSNHLILCHPLLLLPSIFNSIRIFSNESAFRIRWPKYWSFSFSIIPSKEHPGLISFKMDWLDLLAVQGTLKSLLQHHSSKASILQCSAFFTVQLSHPYTTTGKTIASDFLVMSKNSYALTINIFSKKSSFLSSLLFFDWCSRQKKHKHDFLLIAFLFYFSSSCPHEDYIFSLGPFSLIFPRPWLYLRGLLNIEVRRSSIA